MAQGIIADNWSLQEIATLMTEGLENDLAGEILIKDNIHSYQGIPSAIVQTEALFDFLTDLLLRDEILVENQYSNAWDDSSSPLLIAKDLGIIRPYDFLVDIKKIVGPREVIVEKLCATDSLKLAHQENVEGWNLYKETPDRLLSQTLWGGAGMCARSFVYEKSYTPHPLRKRFFLNSGFMLRGDDALHQVATFINDQKVKVSKRIYGNQSLYSSYINLPAIPIRIIQDSQSPEELIKVALQMRDDFMDLRAWLKAFQNAMAADDTNEQIKFRKQLDSIEAYVNQKIGIGARNSPVTMEAGMGIFKIASNHNPIESIKNQFGVRATINKLIFGSSGKSEIRKYVKMFGEAGTGLGLEIEKHFSHN